MELVTRTTPAASVERNPGPKGLGRTCAHPECTTPLCSYNEAETCSVHGGWPSKPLTRHQHREAMAEAMETAA